MLTKQLVGMLTTVAWSSVWTYIILKVIDRTVGLRVSTSKELQGLDTAVHGESIVAGHAVASNAVAPGSYADEFSATEVQPTSFSRGKSPGEIELAQGYYQFRDRDQGSRSTSPPRCHSVVSVETTD